MFYGALLCQNGASSKQASELGNMNNGDWDVHDAHCHSLRGLISWEVVKTSNTLVQAISRKLLSAATR